MDPFGQAIAAKDLTVADVVRRFHDVADTAQYRGTATVERGRGWLVQLILRLAGFPPDQTDAPVMLTLTRTDTGACWQRDFDGHLTTSLLCYDPDSHAIVERLGPFKVTMGVHAAAGRLHVAVIGMRLGPLKLPRLFWPRSDSVEQAGADGRFQFDIAADLPLLGRLIRYRGSVAVAGDDASLSL
jgi:hypothetical protein